MPDEHGQLMQAMGELKGLVSGINQRLDAQNGRVGKLEGKIELIEKQQASQEGRLLNIENQASSEDEKEDKASERRKDWIWGALEKIIFAVIGVFLFLAGLVLQNLHILNLTPNK